MVELIIGKPVSPPPATINKFKLITHYMHGDADGDTDEEHTFENTPEDIERLKLDLLALNAIEDLDECEIIVPLVTGLKLPDNETPEEFADAFRDRYYVGDHTADYSFAASIQGFTLYFYDEHGVEHDVEVKF